MADEVRLIDAEALKNYMCSACPNKERCEDTEQVCSAILDVDEQPTIEAEPDKGWISVDDRLPEPMTMVLVHNTDGQIYTVIYLDNYLQFITGFTVTHWMPLPKPPKGE